LPDERGADDAAVQTDAPPRRPWWKSPFAWAAVALLLALVGLGGYFGVEAFSPRTPPPPAPARDPRDLSKQEVPVLPPGALSCPPQFDDLNVLFNAGARGTPTTSCGFVEQVRREYAQHSVPPGGSVVIRVVSPATAKWYDLGCVATQHYATCTGGNAAVIYLYNKPGG
jgi:hypothetical protein